jgi:molybdopterin/thiamine biosynthesis adenylyltransferase
MNDDQLLRYSRHILLDEVGIEGQQRLIDAHALIIGAGGLGSPAALYLGSSGVGRITLVDDDVVDLTNLQRQIAHTTATVGTPKVLSAKQAVAALNPLVHVQAIQARATPALLDQWVPHADVVLDCTDNFSTRQAINAACVVHRKPLVSASALRLDGQLAVFDTRQTGTPCYACIFPLKKRHQRPSARPWAYWRRWWVSWAPCRPLKRSNCWRVWGNPWQAD